MCMYKRIQFLKISISNLLEAGRQMLRKNNTINYYVGIVVKVAVFGRRTDVR